MNDECGYLEGYFVDEVQGTNDYKKLDNLPTINNVEVIGDLTLDDLNIQPKGNYALESDIPSPYDDTSIKNEIKSLNEKVENFENYDDTQIKGDIKNLTDKVDTLHNYDDSEVKQSIIDLENNKADKSEIPDVSNFITASVDNLVNYYKKSETFTQEEINQRISAIKTAHIEVVETRPEVGEENVLYFIPKEGTSEDVFNEYVYVNGAYELIGTTQVDLSNYATLDYVNGEFAKYVTSESLTELLKSYALKSDIPTKVSQLTNDEGYITGYTETDPTVPNFVKGITQEDIASWNNKLSNIPSNYVTDEKLNQVVGSINAVLNTLTTVEGGE